MAQSRLEKIGTIFSRVSNLIRTGAMNMDDRPLWYDVYRAFPPAVPPKFDRPIPQIEIQKIFYKDDLIRAKFQKEVGKALPSVNLNDSKYETVTQKMIQLCTRLQKEKGLNFDEAYEEAINVLKAEGTLPAQRPARSRTALPDEEPNIASTFKAALQENEKQPDKPLDVNIKNIFEDK